MTIDPSQENINYLNRSLNKFRAKTIEKYADIKCLDVGCGNGKYVNFFQTKINIYGCDYQLFNFSFSGIFGKLFRFLLKILPLRKYPMTILLVAKKRV